MIRECQNGCWQPFPVSGKIVIELPLRTIEIKFEGNDQATATITRKRDDRTVIINIQVKTGEETES